MVSLTDKALRLAARHDIGDRLLMIERGIGYWLTPEGEYIPVPPGRSHADVVRAVIDQASLNESDEEAFLVDANAFAIARGWSRVRIYPSERIAYVDLGTGQQRKHPESVESLIDRLGLSRIVVKYTDEQGNYVSPDDAS